MHSRGGCGKIAFAFPIRYTTQSGYAIHEMPGNPDTAVQLQRMGGNLKGITVQEYLELVRYALD